MMQVSEKDDALDPVPLRLGLELAPRAAVRLERGLEVVVPGA